MNYYNVNEIIDKIEIQKYCMVTRYNIEPNKIILGDKIYSILLNDLNYFAAIKATMIEGKTINTIVGLPITIDYKNSDVIEVCFVLENVLACLTRPV